MTEQAPVIAVEAAKAEASSNGASKDGASKTKTGGRRKKSSAMQELPLFSGSGKGSKH